MAVQDFYSFYIYPFLYLHLIFKYDVINRNDVINKNDKQIERYKFYITYFETTMGFRILVSC
jgi:hypothetical protein